MNEAQAAFISAIANGVRVARREWPSRWKWKDFQTIALIGWHSTQNNCKCAHNGDTKATLMQNFTWKISLSRSQRCSNVIRVSHVGRRQWWRYRNVHRIYFQSFYWSYDVATSVTLLVCVSLVVCVRVDVCACEQKKTSSSLVVVIVDDVLGFRWPNRPFQIRKIRSNMEMQHLCLVNIREKFERNNQVPWRRPNNFFRCDSSFLPGVHIAYAEYSVVIFSILKSLCWIVFRRRRGFWACDDFFPYVWNSLMPIQIEGVLFK